MSESLPIDHPKAVIWRDPVLLLAVCLWLGGLVLLRDFDRNHSIPQVRVTVGDQVALPEESVELSVRCEWLSGGDPERSTLHVDLHRTVEPDGVGISKTDEKGVARRTLTAPESPGVHRFVAEVEDRVTVSPPILFDPRLVVLDPQKSLLVCDLEEWLVSPKGEITDLSREAADALNAISRRHNLVLLHCGDAELADPLRGMLFRSRMAILPVVAGKRPGETPSEYRRRQIAEWTARFASIGPPTAVVRSEAACESWIESEARVISIAEQSCPGAVLASDWMSVQQRLSTKIGE